MAVEKVEIGMKLQITREDIKFRGIYFSSITHSKITSEITNELMVIHSMTTTHLHKKMAQLISTCLTRKRSKGSFPI